jgi:hypothetical protein
MTVLARINKKIASSQSVGLHNKLKPKTFLSNINRNRKKFQNICNFKASAHLDFKTDAVNYPGNPINGDNASIY